MSIAELGPVVILWYETDVSEKAQRGESGKHILTLERKCYLILFLLFEFRFLQSRSVLGARCPDLVVADVNRAYARSSEKSM